MKAMLRAAQAGGVIGYLFLLNACNTSDSSAPTAPNPAHDAPQVENVYSETFADSGRFSIIKDPQSGYSYNVQARIGSQAEKLLATSSSQASLVDIYKSLHGGEGQVPAIVTEVSNQLASQRHDLPNVPRPEAVQPLQKTSSLNDFSSGYCRDIHEGSYLWKWMGCIWGANYHYITTPWVNGDNYNPDRVYAWNATPYTATMSLWSQDYSSHPNSWRPTLQPYWVTWFQWGGVYSNANAMMELPAGKSGELGIVDHYPIPYF